MKQRTRTIPDDTGATAAVRSAEIGVAPIALDALITESPSDQSISLPVGALVAWRRHLRDALLEELASAGRLVPEEARSA